MRGSQLNPDASFLSKSHQITIGQSLCYAEASSLPAMAVFGATATLHTLYYCSMKNAISSGLMLIHITK